MPAFDYTARDSGGRSIKGQLEAASMDAAASQLLAAGSTPIKIQPAKSAAQQSLNIDLRVLLSKQVKLADVVIFCRQMQTLTRAGVPIIRAIDGLADNTSHLRLKQALKRITTQLESGFSLSRAMAQHKKIFSDLFLSMVNVGENTGRLDQVFAQLSSYLELEQETRKRIQAALRYPAFVFLVIIGAMFLINIKVIPAFANAFSSLGNELPPLTQLLIAVSDFFVAYWWLVAGALVGSVFAFSSYIRTPSGRYLWDRYKLKMPLVGSILSRATLGRFARSFSLALDAGVPLIQALNSVSEAVDNAFMKQRIQGMRISVERGESISRAAQNSRMFTPLVLQMIHVGEETGSIDQLLAEVAGFYEREVEYDIKKLSDAIEPIMIVIIGAIVTVLALGIFLPLWELSSGGR